MRCERDSGALGRPYVTWRRCRSRQNQGLTGKGCGCAGARETVRFLPALTVSPAEIEEALQKLEDSLAQVFGAP